MIKLLAVALTIAFPLASGVAQAASPMGQWARGDGNAKVRLAQCGANICATNTWIKPGTPSEKAGDVLVMKVAPVSDSQYSGSAFDPQRNMNYKITLTLNGDTMTTKGCVLGGLLCKGVNWTKIK
ncbi:MAG: hypothetical protein JWM58_2762 [Rhizobium sp.]|nr:hypothetical protein [Rhizobium sp.]